MKDVTLSAGIPAHIPPAAAIAAAERLKRFRISVSIADHPKSGGGCFVRAATLLALGSPGVHLYALNAGIRQPSDTLSQLQELCATYGSQRLVAYFGMGAGHEWGDRDWERQPARSQRLRRLEKLVALVREWIPELIIGCASNRHEAAQLAADMRIWWAVRYDWRAPDPLEATPANTLATCAGVSILTRQLLLTESRESAIPIIRQIMGIPPSKRLALPYFLLGIPDQVAMQMARYHENLGIPTEWVAGESTRDWDRLILLGKSVDDV